MARAKTNKFYRTFSKGLITEAGYLTYPEDASYDELNTVLSRKGNRSRRLGFDFEESSTLLAMVNDPNVAIKEFVWSSVNNDPAINFLCLQVGIRIFFFRITDQAISGQAMPFSIELTANKIPTAPMSDFAGEYCDMSAGSGFLFVCHKYMDPVHVEYRPSTNDLEVVPIVIQIRDFEGVYDGLANDEEPHFLTAQHHYNLLNQGWVAPGTKTVDISVPSYANTSGPSVDVGNFGGTGGGVGSGATPPDPDFTGFEGEGYYDPFTGQRQRYNKTGSL